MKTEQRMAVVDLIAAASACGGANSVLCRQLGTGQQMDQHKKLVADLEKAIQVVKETCFDETPAA